MRLLAIFLLLSATTALAQDYDTAAEQEIFRLVSTERARAGLPSLKNDENLQGAARQHARRMADARQLSHQFSGERSVSQRLAKTGAHFDRSGENVAYDQTVMGAHRGLMNSPPHRANILNPQFNAIGIGVVHAGRDLYVTQDFAHEFEKQSDQEARNAVIAAFENARRAAHLGSAAVVSEARAQAVACDMAKTGRLDTQSALAIPGVRSAVVYTTSDLSELPRSGKSLAADRTVSKIAAGVCFGTSEKYVSGVYWVAIVSY